MPNRPTNPKPDPKKSVLLSKRPVFRDLSADPTFVPWLPDATAGLKVEEYPLEAEDDVANVKLAPCPPDAPYDRASDIPNCAAHIAQWVFDTYCTLIKHRVHVYNKYRRKIDAGDQSPATLGRYRHACRLVCEQIVRRDLPRVGMDFGYYEPVLAIFEIDLRFGFASTTSEIVNKVTIKAVAEVRQRRHQDDVSSAIMIPSTQQQWSSSSSSSSSSEFDPG